jgi:thioredoxin-related protein/YHS domain-containing protein
MRAFVRNSAVGGLIACAALLACGAARGADHMPWAADFRTACGLAAEQHRLVLLHFSQESCEPCRKVEQFVFSQPQVGEAVSQNYIPVKVDEVKNRDLVSRYQVRLFPTDVIVTPSGLEVYRAISPQKPADYIALLNQVAQQTGTSSPRKWAEKMGQYAQQTAQQAVDSSQQYQQQVVGAAEELHQQAALAATSAEQKAAAGIEQFRQQSAAISQQADSARQQMQQSGQLTADAVRGTAQSWQQSLNNMQSDLRSSFLPFPAAANNQQATPAPATPNSPPMQEQPAQRAVVAQHPPLPTENPWLTMQGRALMAREPAAQPAVPPPSQPPAETSPPIASRRATPEATASSPTPEISTTPEQATSSPASQLPTIAASQAPPVALDGFCVVTLIETMSWQKADPKWGAIHRGRTYLFASEDQQKRFLMNPDGFAPALSGCDPVRFAKTGELVEGKRSYGLLTPDKRVFLFADEESLKLFERSPGEYAAAAHQAMLRGDGERMYR